jgi:nucleoside-diphosphate kinase
MESTFVMIKPNGVQNGLIGEIIGRYEKARLSIRGIQIDHFSKEKMGGFYAEHKERPFFGELVDFMTSGPTVLLVLQGENAIEKARAINGATNPADAAPGTIRHDFAPNVGENIVHSSDSLESSQREIGYWFQEEQLVQFSPHSWVVPE